MKAYACSGNRTSTREAVVDAMLASGDELAQLQPALDLLSPAERHAW